MLQFNNEVYGASIYIFHCCLCAGSGFCIGWNLFLRFPRVSKSMGELMQRFPNRALWLVLLMLLSRTDVRNVLRAAVRSRVSVMADLFQVLKMSRRVGLELAVRLFCARRRCQGCGCSQFGQNRRMGVSTGRDSDRQIYCERCWKDFMLMINKGAKMPGNVAELFETPLNCLLYTSPSPRD